MFGPKQLVGFMTFTGAKAYIRPEAVTAIVPAHQQSGCNIHLMAADNPIRLKQSAEEVAAILNAGPPEDDLPDSASERYSQR